MRVINRLFCCLLTALAIISCNSELMPEKEHGIVLSLSLSDSHNVSTKSGEGRVDWNENRINSVYYYLFKDGVYDSQPVLSGFFAGLDLDGDNPTKTWSIPVSSRAILEDLFPVGTQKCHAFIVANPASELASFLEGNGDPITVESLRRFSFYTSLSGVQDSFVMTYEGDVDLISRTGGSNRVVARVNAQLQRLAVKLSVHAKVVPEFNDPISGVWTPEIAGLRVSFHNALSKTNLAGDFSTLAAHQPDYFDTEEADFGNTRKDTFQDTRGNMVTGTISDTSMPMYSYPMKWEYADRDEPFLFVELPWTRIWTDTNGVNHQNTQSCYYKILFSLKNVSANQWYDVTITLDALGSFNKVEPTQQYLYEDYMVVDWNNAYDYESDDTNVDAEIKEARYLVVDQNDFILHDQEDLSIPFSSSHECSIEIIDAYQDNLATGDPSDLTDAAAAWFSLPTSGSVIEFSHAINNTLGAYLDVSPFHVSARIKHTDDGTYSQVVNIVQYPAISVNKVLNSAVWDNNGNLQKSDDEGYVWVNNDQSTSNTNIFAVVGKSYMTSFTGDNNCPYIYEIQVQALSDDRYVLNDPRSSNVENLSGTPAFSSAPALYDGASNRALKYYYPAAETAETKKVISPKFRIASSFGKCYNMSHADAKRRCAAYQEDGYPAGRWRLPTAAEIEFCVTLSSNSKIQVLFTNNNKYWCSTGYADINARGEVTISDSQSGSNPVRCVYDSWYWDEVDRAAGQSDRESRKDVFTWGDQPR